LQLREKRYLLIQFRDRASHDCSPIAESNSRESSDEEMANTVPAAKS
jgi:hypothetical protein